MQVGEKWFLLHAINSHPLMKPTLYQTWCSTTGHLHDFLLSAGPGAPVDLTVPLRRDRHILTGHDGAWSTSGKFRQISPETWENKSQFGLPKGISWAISGKGCWWCCDSHAKEMKLRQHWGYDAVATQKYEHWENVKCMSMWLYFWQAIITGKFNKHGSIIWKRKIELDRNGLYSWH